MAEVRDAGSARACLGKVFSRLCLCARLRGPRATIQAHCGGKLPLEQLKKTRHQQQTRHHQENNQLKTKTNARKLRAKHKHNKQPTNTKQKPNRTYQAKTANKRKKSKQTTNNDYINLREKNCAKLVRTLLAFVPPFQVFCSTNNKMMDFAKPAMHAGSSRWKGWRKWHTQNDRVVGTPPRFATPTLVTYFTTALRVSQLA